MTNKATIYDTSALLNRFFFSDVEVAYITNKVISEIKDFENRQILENKISKGLLKIRDPSKTFVELAKKVSKRTNLSETDVSVLALAIELDGILITDDKALQDCGIKLGLNVFNILYSEFNWPDITKINKILNNVYDKYSPTKEELVEIKKRSKLIVDRLWTSAKKLKLPVKEILLAGSAARQTHLRNMQDLDFFILFELSVEEEQLECFNKQIIEDAFPKLKLIKDYAQHPYFKAKLFGFDVEFVPGYYIKKISERKTAVDRTPLHLKYLNDKLTDELKREIIIARQFFNNNLLYGADLKHNGVPGYLLELLILNYGSCQNLSRAIVRWDNKVTIDVKRHYNGNPKFNDSLIVIDPTDSERNVGAAFSKRNFEICKFLFKEFIKNPTIQFFNGNVYENYISQEELNYAIVFEINKEKQKTEDARWGAMKSLSDKIEKKVKECYVSVKKKSVLIGKSVYLIYLFDNDPFIHTGPLITDSENADKFKQKNKNTYIEDNRLKVKINLTQKEKINFVKEALENRNYSVNVTDINKLKLSKENKKILYKDFANINK